MSLSEYQLTTIEAVAKIATKYILRKYQEDCCIAATRIVIEVLKKLHFKNVKPFVVEANIFNETYVRKGRTPNSDEEAQEWLKEGAWQIVLGERTEKQQGKWPGHLAVLIDDMYLLDIAIFQANRPHKQIHMTPIFSKVPEEFVGGTDKCGLMFNNCLVVYCSYPQDDTYRKSRDWWDVERSKNVVSDVVSEVKAIIGKR